VAIALLMLVHLEGWHGIDKGGGVYGYFKKWKSGDSRVNISE
jgi:hypothetical protein